LTKDIDLFHKEKAEIFLEGLKATSYQQIDDKSGWCANFSVKS